MFSDQARARGGMQSVGALAAVLLLVLSPGGSVSAAEEKASGKPAAKTARKKARGKEDTKECDARFKELRAVFEAERTKEPYERTEAIVKFAGAPCQATVDFLTQLYALEQNFGILAAITQALSGIGSEEAVKAIVTAGIPPMIEHAEGLDEITLALAKPLSPGAEEWLVKNGLTPAVRARPEAHAVILKAISRLKTASKVNVLTAEVKQTSSTELQAAILDGLRLHPDEKLAGLALHFLRSTDDTVRVAAYDLLETAAAAKSRQHFLKGLHDPFWEVRVLALDALARLKDKDVVRHAAQALADKDRRVRATAVQVLIQTGGTRSVEALIQALAAAEGRLLDDITDALTRLTRRNFGPIKAQWDSWWVQNKGKSQDYTAMPMEELLKLKEEAAENQETVVGAAPLYFGLRVLSDNVVFVIDTSESMLDEYIPKELAAEARKQAEADKGSTVVVEGPEAKSKKRKKKKKKVVFTRLDLAKKELLNVLKGLKDGVRFDLIGFNTIFTDLAANVSQEKAPEGEKAAASPPGKMELLELDPPTREAAQAFVRTTRAEGLTNLMAALRAAFGYDETDTIFLLSDGAPTVGMILPAEIIDEIARMNRRRKVRINVISFNPQPSEKELLKAISDRNHGVYMEK